MKSRYVAKLNRLLDQAPQYNKGHKIVLAFVILAWVSTAANVYVERFLTILILRYSQALLPLGE